MLHQGRTVPEVLASAFGSCSAGRYWQSRMRTLLDQLPTGRSRRRVLAHFLRWFSYDDQGNGPVKHGSQWRVIGASGFVGHRHELREPTVVHVDDETGEVFERRGAPKLMHVAANARAGYGRAGGLAVHEHRCPRQLDRYRRVLRGADRETPRGQSTPRGIVACEHPPWEAKDAKKPRVVRPSPEGGKYAYGQVWLQDVPSPEMLSRWGARPSRTVLPRETSASAPARRHSDPYGLAGVVVEVLGEFDH